MFDWTEINHFSHFRPRDDSSSAMQYHKAELLLSLGHPSIVRL